MAKRVITFRSRELAEDGNWIPAASMSSCIPMPNGPAAASLGKDQMIPMMLKLACRTNRILSDRRGAFEMFGNK